MKRLALLVTLLLLTSCLLQRVLVAQLDTIIEYRMSNTLQLYVKQDRLLEKDVAAYLNAQRALAPQMTALIKSANLNKPELIPSLIKEILVIYRAADSDFRRIFVKYLLMLDKEQRKTLFKKFKEMNEETYEKLKKDRTDLYHDRMEFFIGELTESQQKQLKPHMVIFLDKDRERLVKREAFQADIKTILESTSANREQDLLNRFIKQQQESFTDTTHLEDFLRDLLKLLTKEQRERFEEQRQEFLNMVKQFSQTTYE